MTLSLKRLILLIFLILQCGSHIFAQQFTRQIISFDLKSGVFDTLDAVDVDYVRQSEFTEPMNGLEYRTQVDLPSSVSSALGDLVPSTSFTHPIVASDHFDLAKYPISTAVKLFDSSGENRRDLCSGVMISERHVLSSGHCVFTAYTSNPVTRSVEAQIFYDASLDIERTYASRVTKVYFLEGWNISFGDDIAIFELEENIGMLSGWMSIGYNDDDSYFENKHMHKLSYPTYNTPFNDYPFNGDTLYYSHGNVDFVNENFLGVLRHLNGVGGESGSPIFEHVEGERCIAYGVLTWLGNYSHSRFDKERYYAFSSILESEVTTSTDDSFDVPDFKLFPNPAVHTIQISFPPGVRTDDMNVKIFNVQGQLLYSDILQGRVSSIPISDLPTGTLFLHISQRNHIVATKPFVKY